MLLHAGNFMPFSSFFEVIVFKQFQVLSLSHSKVTVMLQMTSLTLRPRLDNHHFSPKYFSIGSRVFLEKIYALCRRRYLKSSLNNRDDETKRKDAES